MSNDNVPLKKWILYVLLTVDDYYYTGITTDLERRVEEHFSLGNKTAKFLRAHPPKKLIFSFPMESRSLALKTEYHFKQLSRKNKEQIIREKTMVRDSSTGKIKVMNRSSRGNNPGDLRYATLGGRES